jgi:hypothetical protein
MVNDFQLIMFPYYSSIDFTNPYLLLIGHSQISLIDGTVLHACQKIFGSLRENFVFFTLELSKTKDT